MALELGRAFCMTYIIPEDFPAPPRHNCLIPDSAVIASPSSLRGRAQSSHAPHDTSPLTPPPHPSTINTGWGLTPRGRPSHRIFRESTMAEERAGTPSLSCMRNIYATRPGFPKSAATPAAPIPSWPLSGNHGSLRPMRHFLATKTLISATKVAAPRYENAASTPRNAASNRYENAATNPMGAAPKSLPSTIEPQGTFAVVCPLPSPQLFHRRPR